MLCRPCLYDLVLRFYFKKPKVGRNEKKARKAVLAHDMEEVPNITRATFKRDEKTFFYVEQPTIYKYRSQDIYVVFGVMRVDNGETSNFMQQLAARKFQAPEEAEAAPPTEAKPTEEAKPAEEEVVDESGLNPDDITFVIEQTKCTRAEAVKALHENNNDMINAVMSLGK